MSNKKRLFVVIPVVLLVSLLVVAAAAFLLLEYHATATLKTEIDRNIKEVSRYVLVEYDNLAVDWLSFAVRLTKVKLSKPPLPGLITIESVKVRDLTSIGIKALPTVVVLENVAGTVEKASFAVHRLAARFSLAKIPSQEELAEDWQTFFRHLHHGELELDQIAFQDEKNRFSLGRLRTEYQATRNNDRNLDLKITKLNFSSGEMGVTTDAFGFAGSLNQQDVLTRLSQNVANLAFKIPAGAAGDNALFRRLAALGYEHLSLGGDFTYGYDPQGRNLNLSWNASGQGMGRLHLEVRLTDFDSPPLPLDGNLARLVNFLEQLLRPAEKAGFQGLKVGYQDFGLVSRLIKAEAQARGQTPEAFSRNLVVGINTTLLLLPLPAAMKDQVGAIKTFLLNPQEIQMEITSKKPVRLKDLEGASLNGLLELLSRAEVKVTAK